MVYAETVKIKNKANLNDMINELRVEFKDGSYVTADRNNSSNNGILWLMWHHANKEIECSFGHCYEPDDADAAEVKACGNVYIIEWEIDKNQ